MTRTHRTIATCLLSLMGLTACVRPINAPPPTVADLRSRWQLADGALDDLDGYLAQMGHDMIRVHRQQGAPVVLHHVQMSSDTLYGTYFDEGIPLTDVVSVDVPFHPSSSYTDWSCIAGVLLLIPAALSGVPAGTLVGCQ